MMGGNVILIVFMWAYYWRYSRDTHNDMISEHTNNAGCLISVFETFLSILIFAIECTTFLRLFSCDYEYSSNNILYNRN